MSLLWSPANRLNPADYRFLLAMDSPWREETERILRSVGIVPQWAPTVEEAVKGLEFQMADFLLLTEGFGGFEGKAEPLLEWIQALPAAARRTLFVIFITPKLRSGDFWSAYSLSVNYVLQTDHLAELLERIEKSWITWRDLYRVFLQSQA